MSIGRVEVLASEVLLSQADRHEMTADPDRVLADLFDEHARALVRMARLFTDDRNAAEDLVQEAFLRLRRSLDRIEDPGRAAAYLRSIVLNLARDHNRKGLMSLRHQTAPSTESAAAEVDDGLLVDENQREVLDAVRALPRRQRDVVVLRYYLELSPPEIAAALEISVNSVKTHLQRGLAALERRLEPTR